jgi:hypothetical protein
MDPLGPLTMTSVLALCLGMTLPAEAQSLKQQLVGTWTLVASETLRADGGKIDEYGQNPKGVLIFDNNDHYAVIIMRSDLPKIAANKADQGTPQENQAIVAGLVTHFGTYAVDEANKTLISHIEASSFPNNDGNDQRRIIVLLTADELKYGLPTTVTGTKAEVTWKRTK